MAIGFCVWRSADSGRLRAGINPVQWLAFCCILSFVLDDVFQYFLEGRN